MRLRGLEYNWEDVEGSSSTNLMETVEQPKPYDCLFFFNFERKPLPFQGEKGLAVQKLWLYTPRGLKASADSRAAV